ncbi:CGP-CTERM sorting domain-containing protein [Thermococcus sp. GR7]|uniref:CGP-CTERM sorting domain-containing protein n=1 Tax=unclassified Thermococcus TaxID=2627626 RepID=UPI001430B9D4|nr:CGP-CTERM sorting domain-containing protein [Thermococcus sp. GR4]NJE47159.1 CGP-CTERM sorting domain-containing protein [Thermococcus sp. GR7]NJE78016.1 CGP-CTERM sorting domain-containing protein [Thermococcus sp. GR4]NJF22867.1 CGP-CTERM sorting domain-containing protein [Thermococcus sp. GR5]
MKRIAFVLFVFSLLILLPKTNAISIWDVLKENETVLWIYILDKGGPHPTSPPLNPLSNSRIDKIYIILPYNETHVKTLTYYSSGNRINGFDIYYPQTPTVPFNLSNWNLSKVIREYQWGLKNYLPNVTGEHWEKGYWNSTITRWEVTLSASKFKVVLHGGHCGECEQYITFECWRSDSNVTCQWGEPVFEVITPPWAPKDTTTSTTREENTICGPAVLIGLILVPLMIKRVKR